MKEIIIRLNKEESIILKNLLTLGALDISEILLKIANEERATTKEEIEKLKKDNDLLYQIYNKIKGANENE